MIQSFDGLAGAFAKQFDTYFERPLLCGPGGASVKQAKQEINACSEELAKLMKQAHETTAKHSAAVGEIFKKLSQVHRKHDLALRKLEEKYKDAKEKSAERTKLERQRNELHAKRRGHRQASEQLKQLMGQRSEMLRELSLLRDQRFDIRRQVVDRINEKLSPTIRVSLSQNGNGQLYRELLETFLTNTRMRGPAVAEKLSQMFAPAELVEVLRKRDRRQLVEKGGINADQAEKTVAVLADDPRLYDLQIVELVDQPCIELLDGDYKNSMEISSGQKCTAVLPILMLDSKNPLMIDQPEDNLDNSFVYETVVSTIHEMKQRRQMIFITHNPNIPVLGNGEMIFLLRSNGHKGWVFAHGSVEERKGEVMTLEGGVQAFEARMEKYGY